MAFSVDRDTGEYANGAYNANWLPKAPGLVVVEHKFVSTAWNTSTCIVFFKAPFHFLRPARWFVCAERFDSNGAPTLAFDVGRLNSNTNPTGINGTPWATNIALGRDPTCSRFEDASGVCGLDRSPHVYDIGVRVSALAATPVTPTNLKMWMGIDFTPW